MINKDLLNLKRKESLATVNFAQMIGRYFPFLSMLCVGGRPCSSSPLWYHLEKACFLTLLAAFSKASQDITGSLLKTYSVNSIHKSTSRFSYNFERECYPLSLISMSFCGQHVSTWDFKSSVLGAYPRAG